MNITPIQKLYIYIFFGQLFFDRALWVIYLGDQGMTLGQIGILEAVLHLTIVLFELPTGVIADLYGRKVSLLYSQVCSLLYGGLMMVSDSFSLFTVAFMSMGLMVTFQSGAEQSFAYDTLKQEKKEGEYTRVFGNMTAIALLSLSLAKLVGGFLAEIDWMWVYGIMIASHTIAFIPLSLLKEPEHEVEEPPLKQKWMNQWKGQLTKGVDVWKKNTILHTPVALYIMTGAVMVIIVFYGQEYFVRLGFSSTLIGLIFTIEGLLGVWMAKIAHRVENRFKFFSIVYYGLFLFLVFFLIFIFSKAWAVLLSFLFLAQLVSLFEPIHSSFVQKHLSSDVRATFFSLIGLVESFVITIAFPLFGFVAERIGFTWGFAGLFMLFFLVLIVYVIPKTKTRA
ncbi:MFS transporter [Halobacillus fulvus]|nr:MFS transporter [Halobacillus fulvus]